MIRARSGHFEAVRLIRDYYCYVDWTTPGDSQTDIQARPTPLPFHHHQHHRHHHHRHAPPHEPTRRLDSGMHSGIGPSRATSSCLRCFLLSC